MAEPTSGRRNPLPPGTTSVGVGLLINGVTAYGFLVISARALGPEQYAPLGLLWTAMFLVGPGLFLPLEQEVSRALADRAAKGEGGGPVIRRAGLLAAGLLGFLLLGLVIGAPILLEKLFEHEPLLLVGFGLGLLGTATGHLARGTCSGRGRFRPYAIFLGSDGTIRLLICGALAVAGVDTPGPYGIALGIAPCIAVVVALARERGLVEDGPESTWGEVSKALLVLLVGSLLSLTLVNGGPLAIKWLGSEGELEDAGRFLNGLIIARVPLFLFQAVQASLLPRLSALAGAGRFDEFRTGMRSLLAVTAGIGAAATVGGFLIGPFVVRTLFGDEFDLDRRTLGLLALACAAYMLASALAQAVIALSGHRLVATAWGVGVAAFVLVTAQGADELFLRVEAGLVAGSAAAALAMAGALVSRLRAGATVDTGSLIEALHELPMEP